MLNTVAVTKSAKRLWFAAASMKDPTALRSEIQNLIVYIVRCLKNTGGTQSFLKHLMSCASAPLCPLRIQYNTLILHVLNFLHWSWWKPNCGPEYIWKRILGNVWWEKIALPSNSAANSTVAKYMQSTCANSSIVSWETFVKQVDWMQNETNQNNPHASICIFGAAGALHCWLQHGQTSQSPFPRWEEFTAGPDIMSTESTDTVMSAQPLRGSAWTDGVQHKESKEYSTEFLDSDSVSWECLAGCHKEIQRVQKFVFHLLFENVFHVWVFSIFLLILVW